MMRIAVLGFLLVSALAVGVYRAKLGAQEADVRISELKTSIDRVQEEIQVLDAEEAYLSRPERIGPLAREKLGLQPASPEQFTAVEMISRKIGEERVLVNRADR